MHCGFAPFLKNCPLDLDVTGIKKFIFKKFSPGSSPGWSRKWALLIVSRWEVLELVAKSKFFSHIITQVCLSLEFCGGISKLSQWEQIKIWGTECETGNEFCLLITLGDVKTQKNSELKASYVHVALNADCWPLSCLLNEYVQGLYLSKLSWAWGLL